MSPPVVCLLQTKPEIFEGEERTTGKRSPRRVCTTATSVIVLLIIFGTTFGGIAYNYYLFHKEKYESKAIINGVALPEHIQVDYKNEFIYVRHEQHGNTDALNALHNYGRKLMALHDLTRNMCFIDRINDTFKGDLYFWSSHEGIGRVPPKILFDYTLEPINAKVLRKFAGDEIANHCGNATSHWMINERPFVIQNRRKRSEAQFLQFSMHCKKDMTSEISNTFH
ncbi:hypothetical protein SNE40_016411 [Patella caerulea]|uniref:Integral membrane protein 2 n=1 Tax=Patella caerulea TaxID=87958 RepID=A0AAN8PC37_PATCE